ncbi:MAG: DUF2284 domain-containing protein [Saccharofermentanales bacterium]|jgi:predicted metal-binding protein
MLQNELIRIALEAGAAKAAVINQSQVVLSDTFRKICETNQCGNFGNCWMCPPFIGDCETLMSDVRSYPQGLLYQSISSIEDSFDIEGMTEASVVHAQLSQRIQESLSFLLDTPFLHLSCGGCHLCSTCAKITDEPCRMPDRALASMEGYCIDVYNTTKDTDLKYINGANTVTYFGIVLFSE